MSPIARLANASVLYALGVIWVSLVVMSEGCSCDAQTGQGVRNPSSVGRPVREGSQTKVISKEDAQRIANAHFGRREDAACYIEDRGEFYFIAPPYIFEKDSEAAGVLVNRYTGRIAVEAGEPES